jgi:hypothetical protein
MRRLGSLFGGLAALVAVGAAAGPVVASPPQSVYVATGRVTALGADGPRVAIAVRGATGCDLAVFWAPPGTLSQAWKSKTSCAGVVFHSITEIAAAGNRVEWLATSGGNSQDMELEAATLGRPNVAEVMYAENTGGAQGGVDGDWLGNLHGDRSLLVFNSWRQCTISRRQGAPPCTPGQQAGGIFYSKQTLWKLVGLSKARIRNGPDSLAAASVDAARIALQSVVDGSIVVVDERGAKLTQNPITAGTDAGTALSGQQVVTLRGTTMQVWNAQTGHLDGSVSLPAAGPTPSLRDTQSGLAVYLRGRAVHVVRLADSKDVAYVAPAGSQLVDAQLEAAGLSYAYNLSRGRAPGRVVFVPWAALQQKLR